MSGGYDVKLIEDVPPQFLCPHCSKLMKDPVQTMFGERACKSCYESLIEDIESSSSNSYFLDKHAVREISQLQCKCKNEPRCQWIGTVSTHDDHVKVCEYRTVKCNYCGDEIEIFELDHHKKELCVKRTVKCEYCDDELYVTEVKLHQITCTKVTVPCFFDCGESMFLHDVRQHIQNCKKIVGGEKCPYTIIGCSHSSTNPSPEDMEVHLHDYVLKHSLDSAYEIFRLNRKIDELQDEQKSLTEKYTKMESLYQNVNNEKIILREEVEVIKRKQTIFDAKFKDCNEKLTMLEEQDITMVKDFGSVQSLDTRILDFEKQLEKIENQFTKTTLKADLEVMKDLGDTYKSSQNSVEKLEREFAMINVNLSDLSMKVQLLEQVVYDGNQLWRVDNITKRMHDASTGKLAAVHSPPAFTERGGYKFCSRLYPNGDGMGKGTHMSLFFVLMKGEFDNLCTWPFSMHVTFRIINPKNEKLSHQESFNPDNKSSSFKKPAKDMNIAAGCPMFIRIDTVQNQNFIVDDCLFFEIKVGPHSGVT